MRLRQSLLQSAIQLRPIRSYSAIKFAKRELYRRTLIANPRNEAAHQKTRFEHEKQWGKNGNSRVITDQTRDRDQETLGLKQPHKILTRKFGGDLGSNNCWSGSRNLSGGRDAEMDQTTCWSVRAKHLRWISPSRAWRSWMVKCS